MLRKHTLIKPPLTLSQIEWEAFNEETTAEMHRAERPPFPAAQWRDEQWQTPTERLPAAIRSWNSVRPQRVKVRRSFSEKLALTWLLIFDRPAATMIMRLEQLAAERRTQVERKSKSHFLR